MTWEESSPFSAVASAVTGILSAKEQGKRDKAEADRQDRLDKAAAITGGLKNTQTIADTDEARARTTGLANTASHQHADDVSHGYILPPGALPPEMPTQAPGKPPPRNRDFANYYSKLGAFYTRNKALDAASTAVGLAEKYGGMAAAEEKQALAVKAQAEKAFQDLATQRHWSADLKQKMKEELGRMVRESMRNGTSIEVATLNGVNAMARTLVTQGGEDTRAGARLAQDRKLHQNTEDNLNRRFNVGEKHANAVAGTVATRLAGKDARTQGVEAYNAIAKGDRFDALTPRQKSFVQQAMTRGGLSVTDFLSALPTSSSIPDPDKTAIKQALGGQ
jgi:hypothetical protein